MATTGAETTRLGALGRGRDHCRVARRPLVCLVVAESFASHALVASPPQPDDRHHGLNGNGDPRLALRAQRPGFRSAVGNGDGGRDLAMAASFAAASRRGVSPVIRRPPDDGTTLAGTLSGIGGGGTIAALKHFINPEGRRSLVRRGVACQGNNHSAAGPLAPSSLADSGSAAPTPRRSRPWPEADPWAPARRS